MNSIAQSAEVAEGQARVLNTKLCRRWLPRLTAFENAYFGADFAWSVEQNDSWVASGAAFYAAVMREPENELSASMSVLLATRESCGKLIVGEIPESALVPWSPAVEEEPVLYLATVISTRSEELPFLYGSLVEEIADMLGLLSLRVTLGLAIAGSAAGRQHLGGNGFHPLRSKYLGKYEFMRITARDARTPFWRRLLSPPDHGTRAPASGPGARPSLEPTLP